MDHIEIDGLRIAYERAGSGPPVVLVHGFVGDGVSTWAAQIDALAEEFTVVAWDAPGAGQSSDPPESFRIADYADCLAGFLEALRIAPAHLVGLSFGGALVLSVFERHPSLVRSLTLVSGYAGWRGSLPSRDVDDRLAKCLHASRLPPDDFVAAMLGSMFSASAPAEAVSRFADSVRAFSPAGFRAMTRASAESDLRAVLPAVDVPTLLLYGDQDVRAPVRVGQELHAAISTSTLVLLEDVGHASPVEAPEAVGAEIRDFLRSVDGATGR